MSLPRRNASPATDRLLIANEWVRGRCLRAFSLCSSPYTAAMTADTQLLQKKLYDELLGHVKQTDVNVPYRLGDYYYYSRTEEGKQYPIFARKKAARKSRLCLRTMFRPTYFRGGRAGEGGALGLFGSGAVGLLGGVVML